MNAHPWKGTAMLISLSNPMSLTIRARSKRDKLLKFLGCFVHSYSLYLNTQQMFVVFSQVTCSFIITSKKT